MKRQRLKSANRRITRQGVRRRARSKSVLRLGASAVEFAIVANILIIMILTCMEFARMNMVRNLAQDAAYFAARHAIVPGATAAEAENEAHNVMQTMLSNGYSVQVSELGEDSDEITVTVAVDLTEVALFAPYFLPDTEIETVARMRTERYDHFFEQ